MQVMAGLSALREQQRALGIDEYADEDESDEAEASSDHLDGDEPDILVKPASRVTRPSRQQQRAPNANTSTSRASGSVASVRSGDSSYSSSSSRRDDGAVASPTGARTPSESQRRAAERLYARKGAQQALQRSQRQAQPRNWRSEDQEGAQRQQ